VFALPIVISTITRIILITQSYSDLSIRIKNVRFLVKIYFLDLYLSDFSALIGIQGSPYEGKIKAFRHPL
jgi:hypothetical protein